MVYHSSGDIRLKTISFPFDDGTNPTYYIPVSSDDLLNESAVTGETVSDALEYLENAMQDLVYEAVKIDTLTVTPANAEMGSTVTSVAVAYALNKIPATLTLDGDSISPVETGTVNLSGLSLTANKTYTMVATDNGSPSHSPATATKSVTLSFLNSVYYGAAVDPGTVDSAFLIGLSNAVLTNTRARTITVNAGVNQYIWYAVPTRLGSCTFKVSGFEGGFQRVSTFSHTNASGYIENYYVYKSDNANLGSTTVTVS